MSLAIYLNKIILKDSSNSIFMSDLDEKVILGHSSKHSEFRKFIFMSVNTTFKKPFIQA